MARVTVEDCVTIIPNRFKLCLVANNRAKNILSGASTTLDINEKPSVIALREIAEGLIDIDKIENNIIELIQHKPNIENEIKTSGFNNVKTESQKLLSDPKPDNKNIFLDDNLAVDD
ncbi:DNA-directed RNA polymerase subunit omega [Rickettsiales bacterium]|nr:DNA-directed RNA polymerase subunit omega [Rickettsiales bacterium]